MVEEQRDEQMGSGNFGHEDTDGSQPLLDSNELPGDTYGVVEDDWEAGRMVTLFDMPRIERFADIWNQAIYLYRECFSAIWKPVCVLVLPWYFLEIVFGGLAYSLDPSFSFLSSVLSLIGVLFTAWLAPTLIYTFVVRLRDNRLAEYSEAIAWGKQAWGRTFGYRILNGLIVFLGMLLLIVPGIIFAVWFTLTDAIVATEGRGHSGVFARSRELTKGYRGKIFGFFAIFMLAVSGIGMIDGTLQMLIVGDDADLASVSAYMILSAMITVLLTFASILPVAFCLVVYLDAVCEHPFECQACGYSLYGNTSGFCTECGTPISPYAQQRLAEVAAQQSDDLSGCHR